MNIDRKNMFYKNIEGGLNYEDLYDLFIEKAKNRENPIFVEIGVFMGKSLCYILERAKQENINLISYAIDPGELESHAYNFFIKKRKSQKKIKRLGKLPIDQDPEKFSPISIFNNNMRKAFGIYNNINIIKDYSTNAVKHFPDNYIDFLFIDGDHSYNAVVKDIECYLPKINKNGIMAGHDIVKDDVKKAVNHVLGNKGKKISRKCGIYYI